jgi:SAM-dependent methyltransferase
MMDNVTAYRLWQAPFSNQKLVPLRNNNNIGEVRAVLDVGCGPGTNTTLFRHAEYVGLDADENYIEYARRRYGRKFLALDVCHYAPPTESHFDFILLNSFLHHVDDRNALIILSKLKPLLTPDGHIHILDLVLPEKPCIARTLARCDRGDFPRTLEKWQCVFDRSFETVIFEPYPLTAFGLTLWNMVYFKGKAR